MLISRKCLARTRCLPAQPGSEVHAAYREGFLSESLRAGADSSDEVELGRAVFPLSLLDAQEWPPHRSEERHIAAVCCCAAALAP